ncbi:Sel1 domain protein repeat-containing protein [Seminavis robusta]|uniref:Sel1 domain protein repeat-containing protein n=1 Tax=Seminavis robusta TaxID=568900 RepID=A0A9N8HL23_9STRA|nr:Sel1 domain protein repeat-containing protein [Seminavis robusta]|eukprot:Sro793_g203260.1 Sel1 domain protein repeat-containing protein (296) ;mRNA; r:28221-29299
MPLPEDNLAELSFRDLQRECRDAGLDRSGTAAMLRKRLQESLNKQQRSNKRTKKSPADDLLCPITLELPWDPVTAEDGRVYERSAIQSHINHNRGCALLRSPMTNEKMGTRLLPAPQHRSLIETLIETGAIEGDLVIKWEQAAKDKKAAEELLRKANDGDPQAMEQAAINYELGEASFPLDWKQAFRWYKEAHLLGHVPARANLGACLCDGVGVNKNAKLGLVYLSMAATEGSDYAAYIMGMCFSNGKYGLSKDRQESIFWLNKCLSPCDHEHMTDAMKTEAQVKLAAILKKKSS